MENLAPLFGFLFFMTIIGGVIAGVIALAAAHHKRLNDAYQSLARHYGGKLHEASWFSRPSVTFHHRGNWVRVDIYSTGGKNPTHYTQVHTGWPRPVFRMEVYPEGFLQRMGKSLLGMTDIEIGAPQFDRDYIITGSSPKQLRDLLNPRVRLAINALRDLHGSRNVYVAVRNHELLIKKVGLLQKTAELKRLVELSLLLYDAALPEQDAGIEFIDPPPMSLSEPLEAAVCQICGDEITSDIVLCRSCKTPHHHDCWGYFGQCSTFGCGERRCYRPQQKTPSRRK